MSAAHELVDVYSQHGWRMIAVTPGGKAPLGALGKDWPAKASADLQVVGGWFSRWPNINVGIVCDRSFGFVLDVDDVAALEWMPDLPVTLTARTPSGGRHYVFQHPEGVDLSNSNAGIIAWLKARGYEPGRRKVDIRGSHGQIVVEPSTRDDLDGAQYRWINVACPIAPSPRWLIEAIQYRPQIDRGPSLPMQGGGRRDVSAYKRAAADSERRKLAETTEGGRGTTAFHAGAVFGELGFTLGEAEAELLPACEANGLIAKDGINRTRREIARGWEKGCAQPRNVPEQEPRHLSVVRSPESAAEAWSEGDERVEAATTRARPGITDTSDESIQRYVMDKLAEERGGLLFSEGTWWRLNEWGAWVGMDEESIWQSVQRLNGVETLEGVTDQKAGRRIKVSAALCKSVVQLARARFFVPAAFAGAAAGFVTPSGLWSCGSHGWDQRAATPADRVRMYSAHDPDRATEPRMWMAALQRMWGHEADFAARVAFLHEWMGAVITGTATRYQVAPILLGDGENGKSVVIDVIAGLVPAVLRCSVTPDDLESNQFASARLVGKALNCVAEIPGGELLTSHKIKAVIDGSEQTAERKGKDGFTFRPVAGHIFSANALPHVRDLSHGFWRRWAPLTCTAPRLTETEKRTGLAQEILEAETPQILGWSMRYLADMLTDGRGYTRPGSVQKAIDAWRCDSNNVEQWVEEDCKKEGETAVKVLYAAYRSFAERTGTKPVAARTWSARLLALGIAADRNRDERTRALTLHVS